MNKEKINHKCDEIEGVLKILMLETSQGKLALSMLALDQVKDIIKPALDEIRAELKEEDPPSALGGVKLEKTSDSDPGEETEDNTKEG